MRLTSNSASKSEKSGAGMAKVGLKTMPRLRRFIFDTSAFWAITQRSAMSIVHEGQMIRRQHFEARINARAKLTFTGRRRSVEDFGQSEACFATHKKRKSVYSSIGRRATRRPKALTRSRRFRRSAPTVCQRLHPTSADPKELTNHLDELGMKLTSQNVHR